MKSLIFLPEDRINLAHQAVADDPKMVHRSSCAACGYFPTSNMNSVWL
jgi:hypothetical protein